MQLQHKTAIITGGASGFGAGMARRFAAEGAQVIVADINGPGAEAQAAAIRAAGGVAHPLQVDVSDNDSMAALVEETLGLTGRIDICINNAGTTHKNGPLLSVDEATFDRVYAVNVKSIYLSVMHVVPVFRRQGGGVFLNIASTAGLRPRPGLVWYAGTKGAVITLTKALAVDLAGEKIRVNAINPVAGDTPLLAQFLPGEDTPEIRQKFIDTIPLGRLSQPDDIAKAALFLCSDQASFITGVCMEVDGGRCI
ncbi:MAG: glucose 1-dehydrogenase [Caldilineaceae bacterium]|nr:glucose 1-dehydrogenase [Caldilineaceae bacterium]